MIRIMCALKDKVAEEFMVPVCVPTLAAMYRDLKDAVRPGQDNPISKYPADYELYQVGTFDSETGRIDVFDTPLRLLSCDVFRDAVVPAELTPQPAQFVDIRDAESRN